MIKNVYLFTGEESLLIQQEIKRWEKAFKEKKGENSTFIFSSENFDNNQVIQTTFWSGFFSDTTLTILKDIPTPANIWSTKYEIFTNEFLKRKWIIPEGSFLVFSSANPDKRTKLYKFLKTNATIKEFKKLKNKQIQELTKKTLEPTNITPEALELFMEKVGDKLHTIMYEIDKLTHRSNANTIKTLQETDIENIVYSYTKQDAFKFFGTIFKYDASKAFIFIDKMQDETGNWNLFLGSIYWTLNLYLILLDFFDQWKTSYEEIKEIYKINPFVLKINLGQKDNIIKHRKAIKNMYLWLIKVDNAIKSWKKNADEFRIEMKKLVYPFSH